VPPPGGVPGQQPIYVCLVWPVTAQAESGYFVVSMVHRIWKHEHRDAHREDEQDEDDPDAGGVG